MIKNKYINYPDVKEETLRTTFQVAGDIENIRVIRDKFTGIGKGFGYILFKVSVNTNIPIYMSIYISFC